MVTRASRRAPGKGVDAWQEEALAKGALTYRDVRREASRRTEQRVHDYSRELAETLSQAGQEKAAANIQIASLRREEARVMEKGQAREYANYLVALRKLDEETD